eukprot:jgi/Chlat1/1052/Chrsp110S00057
MAAAGSLAPLLGSASKLELRLASSLSRGGGAARLRAALWQAQRQAYRRIRSNNADAGPCRKTSTGRLTAVQSAASSSSSPTPPPRSTDFLHTNSQNPPLQPVQQTVLVGGREVKLVRPSNVEDVLDLYMSQGTFSGDPYWCTPWPSAVALAERVLEAPDLVRGRTVCDLGAGLGLSGLAAALAGAKEVVQMDKERLALYYAMHSAAANEMPQGTTIRQELFDFNQPAGAWSKYFDVVFACDVLYELATVQPLATIVPQLLKPNGVFVLADPPNRVPENRKEFVKLMTHALPQKVVLESDVERPVELEDRQYHICIMQFSCYSSASAVGEL